MVKSVTFCSTEELNCAEGEQSNLSLLKSNKFHHQFFFFIFFFPAINQIIVQMEAGHSLTSSGET